MLDVGCGKKGCSLTNVPNHVCGIGVDVSRQNILKATTKFGNHDFHYVLASVTNLPFKNEVFNLIVCVDVLEHIRDKQKSLTEMVRVAQNDGFLVGSTSNLLNPLMMIDCFFPKCLIQRIVYKFAGTHYERHRRLTPAKLAQILHKNNVEMDTLELVDFPPFQPWLYEYSNRKPPWFSWLWIAFDKLTRQKPLRFLKSMMVFEATKNINPIISSDISYLI